MDKIETSTYTLTRKTYSSVNDLPVEAWESLVGNRNIYLSLGYLRGLELSMKRDISFFYSISFNTQGNPVLCSVFQLVTFEDKRSEYGEFLCKLSYHLHKKILDIKTINVLVCGNVFSDGENGFLWSSELTSEQAVIEVAETIEELKEDKTIKEMASITLFKEFWPNSTSYSDVLKSKNYRDFMIDVNMVLTIHREWKHMEDYLGSMTTKYRTRAKGVYKKSKDLTIRSLSSEEIEKHAERIEVLFSNVLMNAEFSANALSIKAFMHFARLINDSFCFRAVFDQDKMVGFSTSFFHKGILEANYVGLDYEYNTKYAVYQRLLYDYVEQSLTRKAKELQLGRTAELVKSQIGALPVNMKLYAKHRKSVSNLLLKPIINSISPNGFELRTPFKANFSN